MSRFTPTSAGTTATRSLVAMLAISVLGACAKHAPPSLEELEAREVAYLDGVIATQERIQQRIFSRLEWEHQREIETGSAPGSETFDVLILSGGGAKGAFGAGVLHGWGQVQDPAFTRPTFDLVTGVSTGSLIAPLAFLGDDASYELVYDLYRDPGTDWVTKRSLLEVLFTQESFMDDAGLFESVRKTMEPRIGAIAAGADEHRSLLVGATNLNQGDSHVWDLTETAVKVRSGELEPEDFVQRNMSSASIPAAFPPQLIDGNLYVDGSVTRDILYLTAFDHNASAMQQWRANHPDGRLPRIRIWVIANTSLTPPPVPVDEKDFAVIGRSLDLSVKNGLMSQLAMLELGSRWLREVEGLDIEFRYVALPDGYTPKGPGLFNKEDMIHMSNLGAAMGRDPSSWRTVVPDPLAPGPLRDELQRRLERSGRETGAGTDRGEPVK